jgi:pimeloyl-ACP methyl ester carboxylesterase
MSSFIAARSQYPSVRPPVTLVYGAADWSSPTERAGNHRLVPGAEMITLDDTGHFASLERPEAVARIILNDPLR